VKGWKDVVKIVQVRTVTHWQKRRFKRFWAKKSQRRGPGRPKVAKRAQGSDKKDEPGESFVGNAKDNG